MQFIKLILQVIAALPEIIRFGRELWGRYEEAKRQQAREEANKRAMERAKNENDQRPIETQLGNSKAGEASGVPGAIVVDDLPGVDRLHNQK